ncbi:MAG: D-amino acid oxidase [Pirellulaceae bacterium]|nr:MAG: D-amino acid oxidase [Pirellulaceae bacterium]
MAVEAYDLAVAGAGIVGAACAALAAEAGLRVVLIEPADVASGATAAGMGHVLVMDDSPQLLRWTHFCRQLWLELESELPARVEFRRTGTVWLAASGGAMQQVASKAEKLRAHGVDCAVWGAAELREAEPALRADLEGGLYVPDDVVLYPPAAAEYFVNRARWFHARMRFGQSVTELLRGKLRLSDGSTVVAERCLLANGYGVRQLVPWLPLEPRKGHLLITARMTPVVHHQLIELGYHDSVRAPGSHSVAFNVQPRVTGQLLIGSSRQHGVADRDVDWTVVQRMAQRAREFLPSFADQPIIRIWTGLRVAAPDGLPVIGYCDEESRTLVATGHEGLGITAALGTAQFVVNLLLGQPTPLPAEWFAPLRFTGSASFQELHCD